YLRSQQLLFGPGVYGYHATNAGKSRFRLLAALARSGADVAGRGWRRPGRPAETQRAHAKTPCCRAAWITVRAASCLPDLRMAITPQAPPRATRSGDGRSQRARLVSVTVVRRAAVCRKRKRASVFGYSWTQNGH